MERLQESAGRSIGLAGWTRRHGSAIRAASVCVIVIGLSLIARSLPVGTMVEALSGWTRGLGVWGPLVYGVIYVAAVLVLAPASALTIAAGAIFGLVVGTITVSLASTLGAALAFLIARHLARDAAARSLLRHPRFEAIDRAVAVGGWKIVALLRLSPAVPFNLQNYLYGLTRIRFQPCVLTSWITMLPGTLMYVYLGYAGRAGLEAASGGRTRTPAEWALLAVGLAATVAVTVYVTRLARQALREQADLDEAVAADEAPSQPSGRPWVTLALSASAIGVLAFAVYLRARPGDLERLVPRHAEPPETRENVH